jgi:hypothetical protein
MITATSSRCSADLHLLTPLCGKLVASLRELTARLVERYEQAEPGHGYVIRKAVAEAERLAWETPFPHLVLPDFAELQVAQALAVARRPLLQAA